MSTILISGANRGIGLEFVRHYATEGKQIIACCREPNHATELKQLVEQYPAIKLLPLDVSETRSIELLAQQLKSQAIDILIANAGTLGEREVTLGNIKLENLMQVFHVNVAGQAQLIDSLLPSLQAGSKKIIVAISSKMGSIADNHSGGYYAYRASKCALNMIMKSFAVDLTPDHFTVLMLHPGWVQTDMGGPNALISVKESVDGMCKVIAQASTKENGCFFDYKGDVIPW